MDTHGSIFLYRAAALLSFLTLALYLAVTLAYNGTGSLPICFLLVLLVLLPLLPHHHQVCHLQQLLTHLRLSRRRRLPATHSRGVSLATLHAAPSSLLTTCKLEQIRSSGNGISKAKEEEQEEEQEEQEQEQQ